MPWTSSRIDREGRTLDAMVRLYCGHLHSPEPDRELCSSCTDLLRYAHARLERCRFGNEKPTCANCSIHCYKPEMRARIKEVMRYSGPRMLFRHPVLAAGHLLDGRLRSGSSRKRR